MTQLVRLFYTSKAERRTPDATQQILTQSVGNNTLRGITGVLLQVDRRYLQVLEGPKDAVMALFTKLQADPRHRAIKIHFEQTITERMFDSWAMASPAVGNLQIKSTLELLTSQNPASQEIGLTYLKYWLTTQAADKRLLPDGDAAELGAPILVDDFMAAQRRSRDFSIIAFCAAILIAVLMDISFYISDYLGGNAESLRMVHSHSLSAFGLILSIYVANRQDLSKGVAIFQITAFISVALHMLYAGYGIYAPSLPYLGLAIVSGIISNRHDQHFKLLFACLGLIVMAALLSAVSVDTGQFSKPVPLHHATVAGLLFPLVCALILDAQRHRTSVTQLFGAHLLSDLSKTIDRLRSAMTARNYFFSAISHEIRTPMAGAAASVSLLKHPNASETIKERSLKSLDQSLTNLNRLLNDLLDISKLESGSFQLANSAFDPIELTRETVEFFQPNILEKGNTLDLQLPTDALTVIGDSMRLQQMIANLVSNAVKFTDKGHITVRLKRMDTGGLALSGYTTLRCEVSDTGIGIPAEDLPYLFQPFSQASQHGYSKIKGTGLGLAIVASLAKQMEGETGVDSVEGQGSTFWFTIRLPIK